MRIGITDCQKEDKYTQYVDWLLSLDPKLDIIKLSHSSGSANEISEYDGLLLTGGGDVNPKLYGEPDHAAQARGVNDLRDEFEFTLLRQALAADMPILGICRGMQLVNVFLGGTLHVDLVSKGFDRHTGSEGSEVQHAIAIEPNSLLSDLAGGVDESVNSFHHQAVDRLGQGLMAVAHSPDGIIEGAEWSVKEGMPFLLLVQWHPERVKNPESILSNNLARIFLREVSLSIANKITS